MHTPEQAKAMTAAGVPAAAMQQAEQDGTIAKAQAGLKLNFSAILALITQYGPSVLEIIKSILAKQASTTTEAQSTHTAQVMRPEGS